jgi:signal transduction histidine kinase
MQFAPIRLDSLLRDICVRASSHYEGLDLQLVLKHADVRCNADSTRIAQVMDNLIVNAMKYAPGTEVIVSLDVIDNNAHISVIDHGPGISPEYQRNLFKRFYRVPETTSGIRGTGLGLFICRQIVEAHGGKITVESIKGEGSTFNIYLNCTDNGMESVPQAQEEFK